MDSLAGLDEIEDQYPLTPLQQGMLFHTLRHPRSGIDIEQLVFYLHEPLRLSAFQEAWRVVAQRHAVLRTRFQWSGLIEPQQEVLTKIELPWGEEDWRHASQAEQQRLFTDFLKQDRLRGIDPHCAPMWRLTWLRLGQHENRVVWTFHHALLDGTSIKSIVQQVYARYDAVNVGVNPQTPPRFREYINWLREQDFSSSKPFWRNRLEGFVTPTPLVVDRPAPQDRDVEANAGSLESSLSNEVSATLTSLAQEHDLTLNTLIVGAWALLLSRYSGNTDIVFGVTRSCRRTTVPDATTIVGLLINTLPMRISVQSQTALLPWLRDIRAQWTAMREFEHTPLALVQSWSDVPAGMPLFKSIVMFEHEPLGETFRRSGGAAWINRETAIFARPNFPLTLAAYGGEEITLSLTFDALSIGETEAKRMLGHLQALLEGIAVSPQATLGDLPLLTAAERQQALFDWNKTAMQFAAPLALPRLFEAQVARTPDAAAVESTEGSLTYRALNQRANKLARYLRHRGVGPGTLVAICMERCLEIVVGVLAILKAGGAFLPIDAGYPSERIGFMLRDAGAKFVLVQGEAPRAMSDPGAAEIINLSDELPAESDENLEPTTDASSLAYVIYTSGSTGEPNGVLVPHRAIANHVLWMQQAFPLNERDCVLQQTEMGFDVSVWEIFGPLVAGARLVLAPRGPKDPVGLSRVIEAKAVTVIQVVPSLLRALLDAPNFHRCASLRHVFCGGEAMGEDLPQKFFSVSGAELHNMYGPTEATIDALYHSVTRGGARGPIPIGCPVANTQAYVLDRDRHPAPVGVPGELYIGGAQLARGYHNRADQDAKRFVADPFSDKVDARLFRTGDIVRRLPDGEIVFLTRADNQIKLRGFRIELGEVERALEQHPLVTEAAVVLCENASADKWLAAYVTTNGGKGAPANELRDYLRHKLPSYMVPASIVSLPTMPLTPNGKLDRQALAKLDAPKPGVSESYCGPHTVLEMKLAAIWGEVLNLDNIGVQDSFFDLGGHSLLAIRLISLVNTRLGASVGIPDLYDKPTVEQLAALIEARPSAPRRESSIVELQRGEGAIPTYFVNVSPREINQARLMETRPIYAIDRPWPKEWLDAARQNKDTNAPKMQEMVAPYVEALCGHAGLGPCVLAGHSFAGLIAFELAHQFQLRGGRVSFVLLFDTVAKRPNALRTEWHKMKRKWDNTSALGTGARLKCITDLIFEFVSEKAANRAKTWTRRIMQTRETDLGALTGITDEHGAAQPWGLVNHVYSAIARSYGLRQLQSRGVLFTADQEDTDWRALDASLGWKGLFSEGLEVVELEGDHLSIFGPERPSPTLTRTLNEALARLPGYKLRARE